MMGRRRWRRRLCWALAHLFWFGYMEMENKRSMNCLFIVAIPFYVQLFAWRARACGGTCACACMKQTKRFCLRQKNVHRTHTHMPTKYVHLVQFISHLISFCCCVFVQKKNRNVSKLFDINRDGFLFSAFFHYLFICKKCINWYGKFNIIKAVL